MTDVADEQEVVSEYGGQRFNFVECWMKCEDGGMDTMGPSAIIFIHVWTDETRNCVVAIKGQLHCASPSSVGILVLGMTPI